ncbi:hypothetical protein QNI16_38525 [Cytophagaceae bacterium YF14B1]|uniref:Uncharacterized protein n=1 Tax=Xanthocytophaga flava TaxID=3048013 RepID=A0AAE3QZR6_9BACT|nr:hypothetical protein [Xanthocytophaga flavus]MDJ1486433.1 hypothetical protein [Xanthocytophaga flavus]
MRKDILVFVGSCLFLGLIILFLIFSSMYNTKQGLYYSNTSPTIEDSKEKGVFYQKLSFVKNDTLRIDSLELVPYKAWLEREFLDIETRELDSTKIIAVISFKLYKKGKEFYPKDTNHLPLLDSNYSSDYISKHMQENTNIMYTGFYFFRKDLSDTLIIKNPKSSQFIKLVTTK